MTTSKRREYRQETVRSVHPQIRLASIEVRETGGTDADDTTREVGGYASVTEELYWLRDYFGPYQEQIAADAFDKTLATTPDVKLTINHDGLGLARTVADPPTLTLAADSTGLRYDAEVDTRNSQAADMMVEMERGTVSEASFMFRIIEGNWNNDFDIYTIQEVDLHRGDVSVVMYGANPLASSEITRHMRAWPTRTPDQAAATVPEGSRVGVVRSLDLHSEWFALEALL